MNVSELDIDQCSGCGLCASVCKKRCITIAPDNLGYLYPIVDKNTCIDCGLCVKNCVIANPSNLNMPQKTYASIRKDREKLSLSSSGGVFAAVAESVLSQEKKWAVIGSALDSSISARHIVVEDKTSLISLYGSKYVQSETTGIFEKVIELLKKGSSVFFSGTPCQVAAVQRYTKYHPNLFTIEIICHGVANNEMFNSYLDMYERRDIKMFYFRDKGQGWSYNNKIIYNNGKEKKINHRLSSYMTYFLRGDTYRDSCHKCPYAKPKRCADITVGDFWGILKVRPDLNKEIDIEKGVSCVLVNSTKGQQLINDAQLELFEVAYEDIRKENSPLNSPSTHTPKKEQILSIWRNRKNWKDVHLFWRQNDWKWRFFLWSILPISLQHKIRALLGRR